MADEIDRASELELHERQHVIAQHIGRRTLLHSNGICSDCDEAISPARLAIDPTFTRCRDCQAETEQREAHFAGCY